MRSTRKIHSLISCRNAFALNFKASRIPQPILAIQRREFHHDRQGNIIPIYRETVKNPIKFISQQCDVLQEDFGKFKALHKPGLNFFCPGITQLVYVINTENPYAVTPVEGITKDNASIKVDGVFYYKIIDPMKAAYKNSELLRSLELLVTNNLRRVIGTMELDALLKSRDEINQGLFTVISPATSKWGVEITRIEIRDILPERKLVQAMDQQMIAEREKRAVEISAAGQKTATELKAQGEQFRLTNEASGKKQAAIFDAEAKLESSKKDAQSQIALADAKAYATEKQAEAEAKAIKTISDAMKDNPAIQNYLVAKGTVEAWQNLAKSPNHKLLLFPAGSNSMVTPLAAAAEMLGLGEQKHTAGMKNN